MKEFQRVSKRAKVLWTITRLIFMLVAVGFTAILTSNPIILISVAAVLLLFAIIYPQVEYIQWSYCITDDRIEIKKGIIWRSHTIVPVGRIQHVESSNGVLQRMFRLSTVKIYTAGGMHRIENLSNDTAEEICALLQQQVTKKIRAKAASEVENNA